MTKVTPDPPNTDNASPHKNPDTEKPDEATDRNVDDAQRSFADIRALPRTPCKTYSVNLQVDVHSLLGGVSEALASACVITMDLADQETGPSRNTLLGVHLIMSVAEISVNRALDLLDPAE
ncbi:hypothetical protein IMF27_22630 [Pseudomonas sp. PCH199]|uniref:DUF6124 family protein n=1 Tax=unclassified Pseudomonas TaxID=196821 RepID=UPI000BD5E3BB|nr:MULTISPECIES: hypothetical protein [unclassified Pseudomonas]MCW8278017.1 hypothetical protein [Pseudomonas sp. PCH199]PAM81713.1 hypothetical protein CES87_23105 [Pseudomonas sp. ERMR1:02]